MKKTPKLRFKEFSRDWEEKKLGTLGEFRKTYSFSRSVEGEGSYKHIHYGDIHMNYKGIISKNKSIPSIDIPNDNYEIIQERDIIFADASEDRKDLGKVAVVRSIEGNVISGLHTICFRPKDDLNSEFFLNHSLNKEYLKYMYTRGNGAKVLGISKSNLSEYKFLVPSIEEQEKIAKFFSLIDNKISLQSEKVEALKDYKKGIMQKIFSRELRFKDDEGRDYPEWEENKLDNICNIKKGEQLNKDLFIPDGEYYVLNGGIEPSGYIDKYNTEADTISISEGGNSCGYINYNFKRFWSGGHCYTLEDISNIINNKYLYQFLKYNQLKIMNLRVGSGLPNIQKKDLSIFKINIPCIDEQLKISELLFNIDNKINKEQEKLNSLNEYKKGLLQQMFI